MGAPNMTGAQKDSPLPGIYNPDGNWEAALTDWLADQDEYTKTNAAKYRQILSDPAAGPHVVVNMGAWAFLEFLKNRAHWNTYQLKRLGHASAGLDQLRRDVDRLISSKLKDVKGEDLHFGAVALESAGIRFYGEYCLVLSEIEGTTQILERDSYELEFPPLGPIAGAAPSFQVLRGTWEVDLSAMAVLKAREVLIGAGRLVTEGRLRDTLLRGEEFIEVHQNGGFGPGDLDEIRQADVDVAAARRIMDATSAGVIPSAEELVWLARRRRVERELARAGIRTRVVDAHNVR
jgi:hypothetical protein